MVNTINGVKFYKYYRKDFTDEERALYNQYVSDKMCVYFKTEKGKLKASEHNKKYYQKKKEQIGENEKHIFGPPLAPGEENPWG